MTTLPDLDRVAQRLRNAKRVLVITGAGISADSGLPTYRGFGGLYNGDALTEEGMPIEEALSSEVMQRQPHISWKYLAQIEHTCRGAQPNRAHHILAEMEKRLPVTVLTQNIDGFHARAGSQDLIEIHGNLFELHCTRCAHNEIVPDYSAITQLPPPCPACNHGHLRPRVVLFNEMLPEAALDRLRTVLREGYDLVLAIGTTAVFPYIAQPFVNAHVHDALAVEINPGDTEVSRRADIRWRTGAVDALQALWDAAFVEA